jgi:hypothetical protein
MDIKEAYDIKSLIAKLEARGLDLAEEGAKIVLDEVLIWVAESADESDTPYDNLVATIFPLLKDEVLKQIDKIDGEVG